jgi:murein DD-endopeptidase MepM/ murein hydrolase activator NlpD
MAAEALARGGDSRLEEEVRRVRRIRGPETIVESVTAGAAGGVVLFVALALLQAWVRPVPLPVVPGRVSAGGLGPGRLRFPVPAVPRAAKSDSFAGARGKRLHLAVDILARRDSPVVAVDDGMLVRLSSSPAGGISVHQLDAAERHCTPRYTS